jgi:hypothetical protein
VPTNDLDKHLLYQATSAVARHLLTAVASALVANGYLTESDTQMFVGAGVTLLVIVASVINKKYLVTTNLVEEKDKKDA